MLHIRHPSLSFLGIVLLCGVSGFFAVQAAFGQSSAAQGGPCAVSTGQTDESIFREADACFTKAYEGAEQERGALLSRIKKALDTQEEADLVQAEYIWGQYRDATCTAEWRLYLGPVGGTVAETACLAAETRLRTASLMRTYGTRLANAEK